MSKSQKLFPMMCGQEALGLLDRQANTLQAVVEEESTQEKEEGEEELGAAFLPGDRSVAVYMSDCISPSHFYVSLVKDTGRLVALETELSQWAEEQVGCSFQPQEGQLVAALLGEGERWVRSRVVRCLGDGRVRVFCVDTGETAELGAAGLARCPPSLQQRLPGQAVRCSLKGCQWGAGKGDLLWELTREEGSDEPRVLQCRVVSREGGSYRVRLSLDGGDVLKLLGGEEQQEVVSEEEGWGCGPQGLPDVLDLGQVEALTQAGSDRIILEREEDEVTLSQPCPQPALPDITLMASLSPQPLTLPRDLPSIQLVSGLAPCTQEVPSILWSQGHSVLSLQVTVAALADLQPGQVHLTVRERELQVQVLEVVGGGRESYTLHSTPLLTLWGGVESSATVVRVSGPRVCLSLTKTRSGVSWQRLVREKFGWIRRDTRAAEAGEESTDSQEEGPGRGFLGPFLGAGAGEKRYHPATGEEVLPEQVTATAGRVWLDLARKSNLKTPVHYSAGTGN